MLQNYFSRLNLKLLPPFTTTVRYRKARWMPTAPSKMFRIPKRTVLPPDEAKEWLRLQTIYKTQMRSLRAFMRAENMERIRIMQEKATPTDELAEFERCSKLNEEWNEELRKKREIRIASENERRREEILMSLERHDKRLKERKIQIEEKVKEVMKEVSEVVITLDKLDGAIEKALANVSHFDYAIDLQGNVYKNKQLVQPEPSKSETQQ